MAEPTYKVRRATLEDFGALKELWALMRLPSEGLEKRLTEFQVVESTDGKVVSALGVQIVKQHALLHNEAHRDFAIADHVRPLLLDRIRSLASNHGVLRLWTRERSPFWTGQGFVAATPETLKRLPETWSEDKEQLLTLQLKDEQAILSMEKELALFMETEKQRSQRALGQARALKTIATFAAIILAVFVLGALLFLLKKNPNIINLGK